MKGVVHHCLLVGAGTAHLAFLKKLKMEPLPEWIFALLTESSSVVYSGMFPGFVSGQYQESEVKIDLVKLCGNLGVELIIDKVTQIDPLRKVISLEMRKELAFETLSINLGLSSQFQATDNVHLLDVRPLSLLVHSLQQLKGQRVGIIGGGMSACELALVLKRRYQDSIDLNLIFPERVLFEKKSKRLSRLVIRALNEVGVKLLAQKRVKNIVGSHLEIENGEKIELDSIVDLSKGVLPSCLQGSPLEKASDGFLKVRRTLQIIFHDNIFAVGDCVSFDEFPELPKNGVHAVRQAPLLYENLRRIAGGQKLLEFSPNKNTLALMNLGNHKTILDYGILSSCSRVWSKWKDSIDRKWMKGFQWQSAMEVKTDMLCGGCGSKLNQAILNEVLDEIGIVSTQREDAAVLPSRNTSTGGIVKLQTVDILREMPMDPFLFGKIAALHSVSDIYAMNGTPETALSIACLRQNGESWMKSQFSQMMLGAKEIFAKSGVELIGGHSYVGLEHSLGFAITGTAPENQLFLKRNLRVGDRLFLTRKIGSGVLFKALTMGVLGADCFETLIQSLTQFRISEVEYLRQLGVRAVTDVTGFGLINHLYEMLVASGVSGHLDLPSIRTYTESGGLYEMGIRPSAFLDNQQRGMKPLRILSGLKESDLWPLFDPQTCGPFLFAVKKGVLVDPNLAWEIGEVVPCSNAPIIDL